jgi:uncharacterized protein (TIGR03435 family)
MTAFTHAIAAALIHFIWQGAVIGALLWLALAAMGRASARARYGVSCIALVALAVLPFATVAGVLYLQSLPSLPSAAPVLAPSRDIVGIPQPMLPIWIEPATPHLMWLAWVQMWALPLWSAGVLVCSIRVVLAGVYAYRLGWRREAADDAVVLMVESVAAQMNLARPVRVFTSKVLDSPSVLGWVRPVLLMPPAAIAGLTPGQLQAVIAHELGHVKRHDYVTNLGQIVVETLFFYHPVVWWISNRIRVERELCCDDLAVACCGDAPGYARALTALEKMRIATPALAMGATGGPLLFRIQRLLGLHAHEYAPSRWSAAVVVCLALACVGLNMNWSRLLAQSDGDEPRFEVASVKRNTANDGLVMMGTKGDTFTGRGVMLRMLIAGAYQIQDDQLIGAPGWLTTDRFDIVAKAPPPTSQDRPAPVSRNQLMMRALLADRFKLAVHRETRDLPVYALVLARKDGRPGPQLQHVSVDCAAIDAAARARAANPSSADAAAPQPRGCGTSVGPGFVQGYGQTMAEFANALSKLWNSGSSLNRPVIDRTGLTGAFDAELRFTPERIPNFGAGAPPCAGAPPSPGGGGPAGGPCFPPIDPSGPSIFTAIQEQLGLKLEAQRGPVDVLVIDRIEPPIED